jgi:4-amino-4-deoxy-L-arabinose transferase-like glycosyltransferase
MIRDRLRWAVSGTTLALHLAVANRYDFFRDELYFIACGRHPQLGYVDQPPIVPLLAAASQAFGQHLFLMRSLTALAAAVTVWITMTLARLVGARDFGAALAGAAAAVAPMYLGLMTVLNTTAFEPFCWTLLAYVTLRALAEPRFFLWAGVIIGIDLEVKYELPIYLVPLIVALLVTGHARALRRWQVLAGAALATVIAAPSLMWQLSHHLPFLQMLRSQALGGKNVIMSPLAFAKQQVMVMNPLFAPVWLAGVIAPFVDARWQKARFFSLAFVLAFVTMLLLHAKDYYVAPLYAVMFAVGGAALEAWLRPWWLRLSYVTIAVMASLIVSPTAMPILSPPSLVAYMHRMHLESRSQETMRQSVLPQTFADMHGWRELAARVTDAVAALPPEERAGTVILARNYGEAGALEFFGHDLPPVLCGHNQYGLWATRGLMPTTLITLNREADQLHDNCREVQPLGKFGAPWALPLEDDRPIMLCRGLHPSLAELWPQLLFYY